MESGSKGMLTMDMRGIDVDGLLDMYADCVRLAIDDYCAGPGRPGGKHAAAQQRAYRSAKDFLRRAGLLETVEAHYGGALATGPEQHEFLFDEIV
jgi:hypothetical protein